MYKTSYRMYSLVIAFRIYIDKPYINFRQLNLVLNLLQVKPVDW
nr:MAG TPA: hypothetical protein [Caudoviricetes sp.]